MAQMTRTKVLWIALGIVFLMFVFNQWMSKEINQPIQPQQSSAQTEIDNPAQTHQMSTFPPLAQEEEIPQLENIHRPENPSSNSVEKIHEPVYEPPTQDIILVE